MISSNAGFEPQHDETIGGRNNLPSIYYDHRTAAELLPPRDPAGHKGTFGKVLCVAGSRNMAGAAILAGTAAYRSGCGMVKILSPECNRIILQTALPEALYAPLDTSGAAWNRELAWGDVILLGPGIGTGKESLQAAKHVLHENNHPLVVDADGLNLLASEGDLRKRLKKHTENTILTPHVGELIRLCKAYLKKDVPAAEEVNPEWQLQLAKRLAEETGCTVVAKSAYTFVCTPGEEDFCNDRGNSGMATAGSGDVLAGCIAGLLAQGLSPREAAVRGVCLHALAGDYAKNRYGERGILARDLAESIGLMQGLDNQEQQ
jgi:NAD(P)H-hydrate epimerase